MMRKAQFLFLIIIIFAIENVNAQVDTIMSYMKTDKTFAFGDRDLPVKDKADADFMRMVTMPDSNIDNTLYQVFDYYLNGILS